MNALLIIIAFLAPIRADELQIGMSAAEVRDRLGPPERVSRQISYHRHIEQWIYPAPLNLRIDFRCLPGQEARVQNVRSGGEPKSP